MPYDPNTIVVPGTSPLYIVTAHLIRGDPMPLTTRVKTWQVWGVTGYGALEGAKGDSPFEFEVFYWGLWATCLTWRALFANLKGEICTVTNAEQTEYQQCLVEEIVNPILKAAISKYGNGMFRATLRGVIRKEP